MHLPSDLEKKRVISTFKNMAIGDIYSRVFKMLLKYVSHTETNDL